MSRSLRSVLVLVWLFLWVAVSMVGGADAQGQPEEASLLVEVSSSGDARLLAEQGAEEIADYGMFSVWRVPRAQNQLPASFQILVPKVYLRGVTLDPSAERVEPILPQGWRQPLVVSGEAQLWLVQFAAPVRDEWLAGLQRAGLIPVAYVPDQAWLVYGSAPDQRLSALDISTAKAVNWQGAYHPYYRLAPALRPDARPAPQGEVDVTVQVFAGAENLDAMLEKLEGWALARYGEREQVMNLVNLRLRLPAGRLREAAALPGVVNVEPLLIPELLDEIQGQVLAGNYALSSGKVVAESPGYLDWLTAQGFPTSPEAYPLVDVMDDGLDAGNADASLHPNFYRFGSPVNPDRVTYIHNCTSDPLGNNVGGHGTINVGILAGYDAETQSYETGGFQLGLGVSPFGRVAATKLFSNAGGFDWTRCSGSYSGILQPAYQQGARLTSNSWGGRDDGAYTVDSQAYDALTRDALPSVAGNQEMLHVFAAGNRGPYATSISTPGTAKNVLTVGATENPRDHGVLDGCLWMDSDSADDIAAFSSRGPTQDGRAKPDVVAPGTHVQGAASRDPAYNGNSVCGPKYYPTSQTLFTWSSGTSHSTPAVAGMAQLLYEYYQRVLSSGQSPSPAMLKALIIHSARYLTGVDAGQDLPSTGQGWGMPALENILNAPGWVLRDQDLLLTESGQMIEMYLRPLNPDQPLAVTLVWTDAPGTPWAGIALVNDLDLLVTAQGAQFNGNHFAGAFSSPGGSADRLNNVERVTLERAGEGVFRVRVMARQLAGDGVPGNSDPTDQDFALVISNAEVVPPQALLVMDAVRIQEVTGNLDGVLQPGETGDIWITLRNVGAAQADAVHAALLDTAGDVSISQGQSDFPAIPAGEARENLTPLRIRLSLDNDCFLAPEVTLQVLSGQQEWWRRTLGIPAAAQPGGQMTHLMEGSFTIPDNNPSGVEVPLEVTDEFQIFDVDVLVNIEHTYTGDLTISLIAPDTREILLANQRGAYGDNFINTIFDDEARIPISQGRPPFTGSFQPESPLRVLDGMPAQGIWRLKVVDSSISVTGRVTRFELRLTPAVCLRYTPYRLILFPIFKDAPLP
ncbi:S8 family serine peptidase [Anaerolinea thermophila]|uniref:S8 family serine peptidase n=2 Tax=Anaerolinea TaxID=233189 RepID=UPI0026F1E83E|nr:S8 family serine peptidase [Anaerolinea thermophila]